MDDGVSIREYSDADKDAVIDLILTIQQKEFNIPIRREDQPDLNDIENFYRKGVGNFWVAVCGGEVVGTVSLLDIGDGRVALRKMFVEKEHRGKTHGVASGLLNAVLGWCGARGVADIFLGTTDKFLAAHRFYEKNGFARVSRDDLPAAFPVMKVDSIFYRRTL